MDEASGIHAILKRVLGCGLMPSLRDCHNAVVKELQARGETVYNPCAKSMLSHRDDVPQVYVKGRQFRTPDFICGTAIKEKDGSVSILPEAMADLIGIRGFNIEDLGLCDPVLYYANNDAKTYPLKEEANDSLRSEAYAHLTDTELDAASLDLVTRLEYLRPCPICSSVGKDHLPSCTVLKLKNILAGKGAMP